MTMSDQPFYAPNRTRVEVQVYREGELVYGRRWANRARPLEEADERKAQYLRDGGVLIR